MDYGGDVRGCVWSECGDGKYIDKCDRADLVPVRASKRDNMKKSLVTLLLLLFWLVPISCWASLPAATTWEVRASVGSDNNGGCFITGSTGTDFSQQNSAQYTFTDLVLVTGTTATSVSHSFVAGDVGNCIHITAGTGFTAGFYQIVSVAAGVLTADRSMGTGASTGGTYAVGGALAVIATANTSATANNTVYMKATASYVVTSTMTASQGNGANGSPPFQFIGYTTTRTDNGRITWTTATNSTDIIDFNAATGYSFFNINFTNTAGTPAAALSAASGNNSGGIYIENCSFSGFTNAILGNFSLVFAFAEITLVNSEVKNSTSHGIFNSGPVGCLGCYIHNNAGDGIRVAGSVPHGGPVMLINSIVANNTGNGYTNNNATGQLGSYVWLVTVDSAFYKNTGDGVTASGGGQSVQTWNTIYYGNGGWGINLPNPPQFFTSKTSGYGSNTSGNLNNYPAGVGDVTLSADPFVSGAGNNFALNSTAGGGAALKAVGYPGVLTIGGTGFTDIGPLQSAAGGGSTGTTTSGFVQ